MDLLISTHQQKRKKSIEGSSELGLNILECTLPVVLFVRLIFFGRVYVEFNF